MILFFVDLTFISIEHEIIVIDTFHCNGKTFCPRIYFAELSQHNFFSNFKSRSWNSIIITSFAVFSPLFHSSLSIYTFLFLLTSHKMNRMRKVSVFGEFWTPHWMESMKLKLYKHFTRASREREKQRRWKKIIWESFQLNSHFPSVR